LIWAGLVLAAALATALYLAAIDLLGRALGLRTEAVTLGAGPRLLDIGIGAARYRVALFPFMGSVTFADGDIDRLPALKRAAIEIAGVAASCLGALLLLGPAAGELVFATVKNLLSMMVLRTDPVDLWRATRHVLETAPPLDLLGRTLAVNAGSNLMPFPLLASVGTLLALIEAATGWKPGLNLRQRLNQIGLAAWLWCLLLLAIGGVRFFLGR